MNVSDVKEESIKQKFPKSNKQHNNSTFILLIIVLVLVVITLIIVSILLYYGRSIQNKIDRIGQEDIEIHPGVWSIFNQDIICKFIVTNCSTPNGSSPYGRCLFPSLGDRPFTISNLGEEEQKAAIIGAHPFDYGSAMVAFGPIPIDRVYYAWTGYLWSKVAETEDEKKIAMDGRINLAASVADSIDVSNTFAEKPNQYLGVIFTANPNFVDVVKNQFNQRLPYSTYSIQWKTIFIPTCMYNPTNDYCLFSRILQTPSNSSIPQWQCWFFQAKNSSFYTPPTLPVISQINTRSTEINEISTFYPDTQLQGWYDEGKQIIENLFDVQYIDPNLTFLYAEKTVPFMSWIEGICPEPKNGPSCGLLCGYQGLQYLQNLRFDNNATIYYANLNIHVPVGYMLVVLAIDHVQSLAVKAYSNITFSNLANDTSWKGVITGLNDSIDGTPPGNEPVKVIRKIYERIPVNERDAKGNVNILITERAYINKNGTGPWYSALLPCLVYIVSDRAPIPIGLTTQSYPFVME